jgi:hypothetical protein
LRRRRTVAVFSASLLAHAALFATWMASRPPELFVEPPAIQVTLMAPRRPPERSRPARPSRAAPSQSRSRTISAPPPPPVAPPSPTPPVPPRILSEQELLAGRDTDAGRLHAALNRRRHVSPWDGCKTLPGPPDWTAPPCPPSGSNDQAAAILSMRDPSHGAFAADAASKAAMKAYREKEPPPGPADPREYPGLRCTFLHQHC